MKHTYLLLMLLICPEKLRLWSCVLVLYPVFALGHCLVEEVFLQL